ncbi:alpha/beta hydrolase [Segetibacter koreensis]|uniref:alpha/beta hydrolase n=1 Tax=Segetibacter koreensis TaxID=398037 RepID=UPI00035C424E|nr:alpha/beta hydrolase family protein [Segetibacter koreensis]
MKRTFLLFIFIFTFFSTFAAIDTVSIYSSSMFKNVKCVVITPSDYKKSNHRYPVVYLLHGYSGNYSDWVIKDPEMQKLSDENKMMIVCPDGSFSSWYFDSPVDLTMHYETNIGVEIPAYIDSVYHTVKDRKARAITGLSMGGHGGLFIGFKHSETFGACGSMSGVLDISNFQQIRGLDVEKRLGDTITNKQYYYDWSVINIIEKYPKDSLAILFDCGIADTYINMNRRTHEKMLQLKIPHTYTERPGKHDWDYWNNALRYQLLFFKQYFATGKIS